MAISINNNNNKKSVDCINTQKLPGSVCTLTVEVFSGAGGIFTGFMLYPTFYFASCVVHTKLKGEKQDAKGVKRVYTPGAHVTADTQLC